MEIGKVDKYYKTQATKVKANVNTQKTDSKASQDSVEFSTALQNINILKLKMENTSDVRTEKVDEVKEQVQSGEYKVDSEKVAEKIIDEMV